MAFVLKNFSGFFIQLYPAVLLGISVFQDKDWKKGRGRSLAIVTGITLCMALGLPAALRLVHRDTSADYSTLVGNVYMFTAAVILVSISFRLTRAHWCTKVIALCISSIYAIAQYLFVNIGLLLAQKGAIDSHQDRLYRPESIILFAATALILSPIFWIFLQKWVRGNVTLLRERQFRYQIRYVVGTTVAYIFVCVIIFSTTEIFPDNIKTVGWAWFLLAVSIIITLSFFFMYWLLFREAFRAEWENRIKEEMRIQQLQYEKITAQVEADRRQRHDIRHHMRTLMVLLEKDASGEAMDYIRQICSETEKVEFRRYCKNQVFNALLTYYIEWAEREGITCDVDVRCGEIPVDSTDLTVLLGNCLENAIEACSGCPEKKISVVVGQMRNSLGVIVKNNCPDTYGNEEFRGGKNQKKSADRRGMYEKGSGIGLRSMEKVLEKYGGTKLDVSYDVNTHVFTTQFIINF